MQFIATWIISFVVAFSLVGCGSMVYNEIDNQINKEPEPSISNVDLRGKCSGSTPNWPYSGRCTWAGQPLD